MKYAKHAIILLAMLSFLVSFPKGERPALAASRPDIVIHTLEKQSHELVNSERKRRGIPPLKWDKKLSDIAQKHARDMAENRYFSHTDLNGGGPTERGLKEGYRCSKKKGRYYMEGLGENIFQNTLYSSVSYRNDVPSYHWNRQEDIADSTVVGWMESSGHRRNILDPDYDKEGIGVAISEKDNKVYIVEMFC